MVGCGLGIWVIFRLLGGVAVLGLCLGLGFGLGFGGVLVVVLYLFELGLGWGGLFWGWR